MNKREALKQKPEMFENRLFFSARNLAIEIVLLKIKNIFPEKFNIAVDWSESSFHSPNIKITLTNPRESNAWSAVDFIISVNRETIQTYSSDNVSNCFYNFKDAHSNFTPFPNKHVDEFKKLFLNTENIELYKNLIDGVNYPFNRERYSSF